MKKGFVYLAGAGPGDPDLITRKALDAMAGADCIIYDYLASPEIVNAYSCEKIYVGKQGSDHTLTQEEINRLIVEKANEGKTVVRLKGGDPYIFGRGGEEAEDLVKAGIPFAVIPGISSFYSAPAYAGIPLTHRDYANAVEVITGHRRGDSVDEDVNFPAYDPERTYTFLMGMKNLAHISTQLIEKKNFPADTPVAIVTWGTTPRQQVATGTLADIAARVVEIGMKPPAIIVVGKVVQLRETLRWFDTLPLFGRRIVVTRTRTQASKLSGALRRLGADVIEFPTIIIEKMPDMSPLHDAFTRLKDFNWVVFTSQNAVQIFFEELRATGRDARALGDIKIAAIGPATAKECESCAIVPDLVPDEYVAEALVEAFAGENLEGQQVLLPCSQSARMALTDGLRRQGARVERVHIYDATLPLKIDGETMVHISGADIITFTSSSTARNFFSLVPDTDAVLACIGPVTAETVREHGYDPEIEAGTYTIDGLVESIVEYENKRLKS